MVIDGDDVYERRTRLRMTQTELARLVDVSAGHISNIETGKAELLPDLAVKIEVAFKVREKEVPPKETTAFALGRRMSKLTAAQAYQVKVYVDQLLLN
ncbi:helix-turn-helix transcriptional regulator [Streptomyces antibioticus]|uniref:helix-turn-helix transcriptional regulator n=1 Tax=Streptomyces antibioticus TaxID=1890 RepID=UPI003D7389C4